LNRAWNLNVTDSNSLCVSAAYRPVRLVPTVVENLSPTSAVRAINQCIDLSCCRNQGSIVLLRTRLLCVLSGVGHWLNNWAIQKTPHRSLKCCRKCHQ